MAALYSIETDHLGCKSKLASDRHRITRIDADVEERLMELIRICLHRE